MPSTKRDMVGFHSAAVESQLKRFFELPENDFRIYPYLAMACAFHDISNEDFEVANDVGRHEMYETACRLPAKQWVRDTFRFITVPQADQNRQETLAPIPWVRR